MIEYVIHDGGTFTLWMPQTLLVDFIIPRNIVKLYIYTDLKKGYAEA